MPCVKHYDFEVVSIYNFCYVHHDMHISSSQAACQERNCFIS